MTLSRRHLPKSWQEFYEQYDGHEVVVKRSFAEDQVIHIFFSDRYSAQQWPEEITVRFADMSYTEGDCHSFYPSDIELVQILPVIQEPSEDIYNDLI